MLTVIFLAGCGASETTSVSEVEATEVEATVSEAVAADVMDALDLATATTKPTRTKVPTSTPSATRPPRPSPTRTPTAAATATATETVVVAQVVAALEVNVRAGPGTNYDIVTTLPSDVPLPIVGRNEAASWWQIEGPEGNRGWVADSVVTASNTTEITIAEAPPPPTSSAPTPTPTPEPPPQPDLDFRIATWRLKPVALNGCVQGGHTIFIDVLDVNGVPLDNIVVGDSWGNVETMTGSKGPGKAEIDLWSNTMDRTRFTNHLSTVLKYLCCDSNDFFYNRTDCTV